MMKKLWTVFLIVILVGGLASFAIDAANSANKEAKPEGIVVDVTQWTGTVKAVDLQKRTATIEGEGGKTVTLNARNARNLDQVKAGDKVKVEYIEELAVSVRKAGTPADTEAMQTVALAPKGEKPGGLITNTVEIQANVEDVNHKHRTIKLETPGGKIKSFKVDRGVENFDEIRKGDQVVLKYTEALALNVVSP
jgi:hypothetical protein